MKFPPFFSIYHHDHVEVSWWQLTSLSLVELLTTLHDEVEVLSVQLMLCEPINRCLIYNPPSCYEVYKQDVLSYSLSRIVW